MVYVSTHAGKRHSISEDAVLVGSEVLHETDAVLSVPDNGFVCIADGVGGIRGGEMASRFVLVALVEGTNDDLNLKDVLSKINEALIAAARVSSAPKMATTLTGFQFGNRNRVVHVGNTRAYVKQGKYLKQITPDHTTFNFLMSSGQIDAAQKCNKNEITNCFGGGDSALLSKLYTADCQPFSLALLTSDGVHEYVSLDEIEEILSGEGTLSDKCKALIQAAIDGGSEDDLSVVIICPVEASTGTEGVQHGIQIQKEH